MSFSLCVLEFQKIYERLGVTIKERGESFYQPLMEDVIKDLRSKGTYANSVTYIWC